MKPPSRALLAALRASPALAGGSPWRPDDVLPLPDVPPRLAAAYRSGREGMLAALVRRGLLARLPDGRYRLTAPDGAEAAP
jgi:hypothetical protein